MQWERTYKEFFDLITETYEQHKRKPQDLEKALRKVIKREKEVLEKSQGQDRPKKAKQNLHEDCQERSDIAENKNEKCETPALDKRSEGSSPKEDEESGFALKETKVVDMKSVGCQAEAADSSYARGLKEKLEECKGDLEAKERQIESLMRRVAHYSDMRTKQDQRYVEDTRSLNRQSRVEQDFKAFTSDERIDACSMIQNGFREKTDINAKRLSSMMFEVVYEYVLCIKEVMTDTFKGISKFAVDNGPYIRHLNSTQNVQRTDETPHFKVPLSWGGSEYPRDVVDVLLLAIKESAPDINTDVFLMDVKCKIFKASQELKKERSCKLNTSEKLLNALDDYLKACIKLTWRMVTQVPPLKLEYRTFTYKRECHNTVQYDARDGRYEGHKVYYLWPGLVDGGGRIIIKGEVALDK